MPCKPKQVSCLYSRLPQLFIRFLRYYISSRFDNRQPVTKERQRHKNGLFSIVLDFDPRSTRNLTALYPNLISPIPDRQKRLHHKGHLPVQADRGHAEPVHLGIVSSRTQLTLPPQGGYCARRTDLHFSSVPPDSTAHIPIGLREDLQDSSPRVALL